MGRRIGIPQGALGQPWAFTAPQGGWTGPWPPQGNPAGGVATPATIFGADLVAWYDPTVGVYTNAAAQFASASTQYLEAAVSVADFTRATGGWSFSFWARPEANGGNVGLIGLTTTENIAFRLIYLDAIALQLQVFGDDASLSAAAAVAPSVDAWHHYAGKYNPTTKTCAIYIDAVRTDAAGAHTGTLIRGATNAVLALAHDAIGSVGNHRIQMFAWYKGVQLSDADVTALYNAGAGQNYTATSKTGLFAFNPLCEPAGARADQHGATDFTAVNAPTVLAGHIEADVAAEEIDNAPVSARWEDQSAAGDDAVPASVAESGLYLLDADGAGNPGLDLDGTDDHYDVTAAVAQPFTVAGHVRFDANGDAWVGLDAADEWIGRGTDVYEIDMGGTNRTGGTAAGAWARVIAVVNGASSVVYIDGVSTVTGDPGAAGAAAAWILGAKGDGSAPLNGRVRHVVMADVAASAGQVTALDAWLAAN